MSLLAAGCAINPAADSPSRRGTHHTALTRPTRRSVHLPATIKSLSPPEVVVRAAWGDANTSATPPRAGAPLTRVGKRDEASRPGPMSLTVGDDGSLYLLDQVNHRVLRFTRDGHPLGEVATLPETTEDIVVSGTTLYALIYERDPPSGAGPGFRLERHRLGEGTPPRRIPLSRRIQLVTGLFLSGDAAHPDVWVETRHDRATRVVRRGLPVAVAEQRHQVLGRPLRTKASSQLTARRIDRHVAKVARVSPQGATPLLEVHTLTPLLGLFALAGDARGHAYLGLLVEGASGQPPRRLLLVIGATSVHLLALPGDRVTDAFHPLAVGTDGSVYHLTSDARGVEIHRFTPEQIAHALTIPSGGAS